MAKIYDVVVAGAGPAGLAVSAALVRQGLKTVCVDPALDRRWVNNTCAWSDEIEPLGMDKLCDRIWDDSEIIYSEKSSQTIGRRYAHFDNDKLKAALLVDGLDTIIAKVEKVRHDDSGSNVTLEGGETLRASIVIDATGHDHSLILPLRKEADAFQNIFGIMARVDKHPYNLNHMILMDFRSAFLGKNSSPPTFLYAMPYESDYVFFEETSLVDSPGVPFELLSSRLERRLASLDINVKEVEYIEQEPLPMNQSVPDLHQRVIGFGAAAGFVHPSSGWSVSYSLNLADPVAKIIANGLGSNTPPIRISQQVWSKLWTPELLRMRDIHLRGADFFCRIDVKVLSLFMKMFFNAPGGRLWKAYLANDSTVSSINKSFLPF